MAVNESEGYEDTAGVSTSPQLDFPPPQHSIFEWANLWSQAMMAGLNLVNLYA